MRTSPNRPMGNCAEGKREKAKYHGQCAVSLLDKAMAILPAYRALFHDATSAVFCPCATNVQRVCNECATHENRVAGFQPRWEAEWVRMGKSVGKCRRICSVIKSCQFRNKNRRNCRTWAKRRQTRGREMLESAALD